ncbi:GNAT family N-acetyltransferase [soil metagenome]
MVRSVTAADEPALAAVAARAFEHDPIWTWIVPDERTRLDRLTRFFEVMGRRVFAPAGRHRLTTTDLAGMAVWAPPGTWRVSPVRMLPAVPGMVRALGSGTRRVARFSSYLEKKHPAEPHWYLEMLATAPAHQRRGVGAELVAPVLERCDTEGILAYLETETDANVPYYRRHGFDVTEEVDIPGGGPHLWLMARPPRPR